jgi:hypothetical protein
MLKCQMMRHRSNPYFIRSIKLPNKKAENDSAFLFKTGSEINSAQMVLHQQISGAIYQFSYLLFGRSQPIERQP